MLETSLLVVAFALFPFIPSTLGLAPDLVWRISAGAFVFADAAYWALTRKRGKALHTLLAPSDRRLSLVTRLLAYATDSLMIAVVLGLVGSAASGLYFTALYIELIISGALFVSFAGSAFGGVE